MNHIVVMDDNHTPIHLKEQGKTCRGIIYFALFTFGFILLVYFIRTGKLPSFRIGHK